MNEKFGKRTQANDIKSILSHFWSDFAGKLSSGLDFEFFRPKLLVAGGLKGRPKNGWHENMSAKIKPSKSKESRYKRASPIPVKVGTSVELASAMHANSLFCPYGFVIPGIWCSSGSTLTVGSTSFSSTSISVLTRGSGSKSGGSTGSGSLSVDSA